MKNTHFLCPLVKTADIKNEFFFIDHLKEPTQKVSSFSVDTYVLLQIIFLSSVQYEIHEITN
jgi:hypothetical protein